MNKRLATQILSIITLLSAWLLITTPAIALTDLQGQPVKLENIVGKGKWTVMKIWASDCHVCRQTIHYLSDFEVSFPEATVYGISIDGQEVEQYYGMGHVIKHVEQPSLPNHGMVRKWNLDFLIEHGFVITKYMEMSIEQNTFHLELDIA